MKSTLIRTLFRKRRLALSTSFSFALHAFILFGITFTLPDVQKLAKRLEPLEVTLVNSKTKTRPNSATAYAQNNLDGGGNVMDDRRASTPFPVISDDTKFTPEQTTQRTKELEEEVKRLLTQNKSNYRIDQQKAVTQQTVNKLDGQDMVQLALEIARLEAEINKSIKMYERMPKRKFIGARTQEYRYAQYVEDWRSKVERVGNMNYPQQARDQNIYGKLTLTISIRSDGSVENVEINKSSGQRILDAAAVRIVRLAAPYAPFPNEISKDTDILSITRTWSFTINDQLESE
ncbi:MAG: energy transducer TonB [Sideroxydans sp.]|nr:energy transducer TonB [Sideroxydans sp.]